MRKLSRRSTAVVVTSVVAVGAAGAAWAAWSLTGSGTAEAKAGSVVTLKVTSAGLAGGGLTPGNATTVLLTVENRNAFPVRITDIDLKQLDSPQEGCAATDNVEIVNDAPLPAPAKVTVPAGGKDDPVTAQIAWAGPLRMVADPADACQGAPFTFDVHLDAVSAAA